MLFMKWKNKRDVLMLSTFHDKTFIEKRHRTRLTEDGFEVIMKLKVVKEYNLHMGAWIKVSNLPLQLTVYNNMHFSLADQMVVYYGFAHHSIKWWKRVFFHILDTCIVNTHILYNASSSKKLTAGVPSCCC